MEDEDVLYGIFNQCSLRDTIRMGAVCKLWLSVSRWSRRSRPQLPWLMMLSDPNFKPGEKGSGCLFSLSENAIYDPIEFPEIRGKRFCGSFNNADACGWLMTLDNNLNMQLFQRHTNTVTADFHLYAELPCLTMHQWLRLSIVCAF